MKFKNILIPALLLLIVLMLAIYKHTHSPKYSFIDNISLINAPDDIKKYLLTQNEAILILIEYDGKNIYAYTKHKKDYTTACAHILDSLIKISKAKDYKLPSGYYLLALDDGIHRKLKHPVLGFAGTHELVKNQEVILIPDHQALKGYAKLFASIDKSINQYPWETKTSKIFWRGGPGSYINKGDNSAIFWNGNPGNYVQNNDLQNSRLQFLYAASKFHFTDVGIAKTNLHIAPDLEKKLKLDNLLKSPVLPAQSIAYKYLFDLDGYSCAYSRMAWILYSNSVLFKHVSDKIQWYYDQLQPYVHYLPVAEDFSNLQQQYMWAESNSEDAKNIAMNGRKLAQEVFAEDKLLRALEQGFIKYHYITQNTQQQ